MRLRLILALLVGFGLAACESVPDESADATSGGTVDTDGSIAEASDAVVQIDPDPVVESTDDLDSTAPPPGSQADLVQNVGDRIFFEFDSAVLGADARRTLERQAEWLKLFPEVSLVIEGHCDERGTREYNLALGERRANAVREFLIALGIEPSRLRTLSYGKERPYALGHDDEAWALNRRAVSVIE